MKHALTQFSFSGHRFANTRTKSIQKQVKSVDVDKVRSKKLLASKSCFVKK